MLPSASQSGRPAHRERGRACQEPFGAFKKTSRRMRRAPAPSLGGGPPEPSGNGVLAAAAAASGAAPAGVAISPSARI